MNILYNPYIFINLFNIYDLKLTTYGHKVAQTIKVKIRKNYQMFMSTVTSNFCKKLQ